MKNECGLWVVLDLNESFVDRWGVNDREFVELRIIIRGDICDKVRMSILDDDTTR